VAQAFVRFWEGERDREKLLHGIECSSDRALVNYVYDTHFAPLINRKAGGVEAEVEAYYRGPKHVALRRIVQLTSDKTWNNGRMRFGDGGVYSERQKVISDWLPGIESDGYQITAKIASLWNDERDPETLFGGLDEKSELLMRKLWRQLMVEEGQDAAQDIVEDLDPNFHPEAALVAFVARKYASNKATPDVEALRKRMSCYMHVMFHIQGISITATQKLNAAVEKIYEGERDKDALLSAVAGQKNSKSLDLRAFVLKVLSLIETGKEEDLEAKSKKDETLKDLVWGKPNFEGFYDKHSRIFRRIVQLCEKECALKHAEFRVFPWTGNGEENMEKERGVIMREFVGDWTAGNWHLKGAIARLWEGVRDYDTLCSGIERHPFSKVRSIGGLYSKYTSALTLENMLGGRKT
jgi:hypothetical protein